MSLPTSVEQVINQALDRIGYRESVGNIYEGTRQARVALDVYTQTRDELLRANDDWDFSERNFTLTLLKQAPEGGYVPPVVWSDQYPALPWLYEYAYPSDCIKVRSIRQQAIFVFDFDPQPQVFSITNDTAYTPPQKALLCNVPSAILTYTGQVEDLTTWEAGSIEVLIATLALRLAPALRAEALKPALVGAAQADAASDRQQG